ncbi:MAG: anaerobic ribonucleoside-triphosphate reductase activating protein [Paraclostridium sp.]
MSNIIILDETIDIKVTSSINISKYRKFGYLCSKGDTITIDVKHLNKTSNQHVRVVCPVCKSNHTLEFVKINQRNHTKCKECMRHRFEDRICQFCGDIAHRTHKGRGICNKHRYQIRRYGKPILGKYELNKYEYKDKHVEIILETQGKEVGRALVSIDDFEIVKNVRWHLEKSRGKLEYAANCSDGKTKRMHKMILSKSKYEIIDHIDGNGLNNTRENLRVVTSSENACNSKVGDNTYSGIKGISYDKRTNKWVAYITKNRKNKNIGQFNYLENAKTARLEYEKKLHKEYSRNREWKDENVKIMDIVHDSVVDGEGLRSVLFLSGCDKQCPECHNKESWNVKNGKNRKINDVVNELVSYPIGDITISGGDPLSYQFRECYEIVKEIKLNSNKNIWLYTGMTWEEILTDKRPIVREILKYVDVLVDGRFNKNYKSLDLKFKGDITQRIIDVQQSLKQNKIIEI